MPVEREVLHRDGPGDGEGLLRLHHDRGHADGVRGVRRHHGGVPEVRDHGAQARPGAAGRDHGARPRRRWASSRRCRRPSTRRSCWPGCASTLDSIAEGRFGWNIVTSGEDGSAQNFGMDKLTEHDLRYDIADEYVDLVCQLWDSWEPDAVIRDRETNTYADFKKVHAIDFAGKYFKSRGPLNTVRSPQGRPTFVQAGRVAARPAVRGQVRRLDHRRRQRGGGDEGLPRRRPGPGRGAGPQSRRHQGAVRGEPRSSARPRRRRWPKKASARTDPGRSSSSRWPSISSVTDIDFSQFDLDEPLPAAGDQRRAGLAGQVRPVGQRQDAAPARPRRGGTSDSIELVGTPDQVAEKMGEAMERGRRRRLPDQRPDMRVSKQYITEICDGLIPALQRRGLTRTEYAHSHLRDTLREF